MVYLIRLPEDVCSKYAETKYSRDFALKNFRDGVFVVCYPTLSTTNSSFSTTSCWRKKRRNTIMADKEATVYIIDMGRSMGEKRNARKESDLDWAMTYVWEKITSTVGTWSTFRCNPI